MFAGRFALVPTPREGSSRDTLRLHTRRFERLDPPDRVVHHCRGALLQVGQVGQALALPRYSPEVLAQDMYARPRRHHLKLDTDQAELLDRAGGADHAVAHVGGWLAIPLGVRIV